MGSPDRWRAARLPGSPWSSENAEVCWHGGRVSASSTRSEGELQLMGPFGPTEIIIILLIALIVFGPKRLPEMGKSLGKGIREFKSSVTGEDDDHSQQVARAQELPPAAPAPAPVAQP